MLAVSKFLTGTAGLALVAGAATPAAAQSYPYGGYGYGNPVGQVINQVLGGGAYGQYGYGNQQYGYGNSRVAVDQCARAAVARVSGGYGGYGAYNQRYNNRGYGYNGYNNAGAARVVAITRVEQRSNGLRVRGVIDVGGYGAYGNQGYGYGNRGYGNRGYAQQLDFKCTVDYRGYVRDVDLDRRSSYYRGY